MGKSQQIVGRDVEEAAKRLQILYTRLVAVPFQIGNLPLGHMNLQPQLGLIQLSALPEQADFLAQGQFHSITREKCTMLRWKLLHYRWKMSIMRCGGGIHAVAGQAIAALD